MCFLCFEWFKSQKLCQLFKISAWLLYPYPTFLYWQDQCWQLCFSLNFTGNPISTYVSFPIADLSNHCNQSYWIAALFCFACFNPQYKINAISSIYNSTPGNMLYTVKKENIVFKIWILMLMKGTRLKALEINCLLIEQVQDGEW